MSLHHPGKGRVALLLFISLPLFVNTMSISNKVTLTSVELTQKVSTENDPNPDTAIFEDYEDQETSFTSIPLSAPPVLNEVAESPVLLIVPTEDDNNIDLIPYPEEDNSLTPTPTTSSFNVFKIYNSENNVSIVSWNCTLLGESASNSEGCIALKDNLVEKVFQPAEPLFNTMIANVAGDDSKMTFVVAGSTRDTIVDKINSEILKKMETEGLYGEDIRKIKLVKNADLVVVLTLKFDDTAEIMEGEEENKVALEDGDDEETANLIPDEGFGKAKDLGQDEEEQVEVQETADNEVEVFHVEQNEGDEDVDIKEDEEEVLDHQYDENDETDDGGNLRPEDDGDNLALEEEEEEGGTLRHVEELPAWTAEEILEMEQWCNVCVNESQRFIPGSFQQVFSLSMCARKLSIRSFDVAVCDKPLPKEGDPRIIV